MCKPVFTGGIFDSVSTLPSVTVDMDSTVITRHGEQQGATRGYNPNNRGRLSHHPLLAFVSEARMVANFWLRPGDANSANNVLQFIDPPCITWGQCRRVVACG